LADDIINEAPIFCKGERNGRKLTKKIFKQNNLFMLNLMMKNGLKQME
jgi:hypothetical protein